MRADGDGEGSAAGCAEDQAFAAAVGGSGSGAGAGFLTGYLESLTAVMAQRGAAGLVSYTPLGDEALFEGILSDVHILEMNGDSYRLKQSRHKRGPANP